MFKKNEIRIKKKLQSWRIHNKGEWIRRKKKKEE